MNRANRPRQPRIPGSSYASRALSRAGDGSTLSLDFTTGVLDPRLTFSRAGGGTYVGPDGYIYGIDSATSSSLAIGTGSKSVTLTATAGVNRQFEVGQTVYFSNGANNMSGLVTAYSPSTQVITINATSSSGSGSFTSWFVGNASARFDYEPIALTPRGLLIEGSSINYTLESTSLSGYSNSNMVAVSSGNETDPEGNANSAKQIYATSGASAYRGFYRTISAGTNTQITVSIWAKARNYTFLFLSDLASGRGAVRFNLNTGATDNNFGLGFVSAKATQFQNGWWRCEMVVNVTASTSYGWAFVGTPSGAVLDKNGAQYAGTGNAADGIYCYGFQVEAGSGASSYIPTGASQGSRAADVCNMTGTNFSSWFTQGAGTIVAQSDNTKVNGRNLLCQISNAGSTYIQVGNKALAGGGESIGYLLAGSIEGYADSNNNPSLNTAYKSAYVWDTSYFNVCVNGTLATADTSGNVATSGMTQISIGSDAISPTDTYIKNGHIKSLKYWPTRLSNAQLQALTT